MPAMKNSRDQLKVELVKRLEGVIDRVLDWQEEHPTFTLTELEDFVLALRREMGGEIAEALIGHLGGEVLIEGLRCEQCGGQMVYKGLEAKHVETRAGGIEIERGRYWCSACQAGIFPPG
jgi:hypothetical protein